MADYDDKLLGPIFPTRSGTAQGGATERQMLDSTQGAAGIRTKIKMNPDGSQTRLRTRAGMPEFVTIDAESGGGDEVFHGGLAGEIYSAGAASGKPSIYKLSPAIITPGKKAPGEVEAYALTVPGGGGYSYRKDGSVKVVWTSGNSKVSGDLHEWKKASSKTIQSPADSFYIPFSLDGEKYIASDTSILAADGTTVYGYARPWRTFSAITGPRQYDKLYPLVSYDQAKAVLQSSDSQSFSDSAPSVATDLTRLYDGFVFDAATKTAFAFSGELYSGYSIAPTISDVRNEDGESLSREYPCYSYRPYGLGSITNIVIEQQAASVDGVPPARADSSYSESMAYSGTKPFTKTVLLNDVVDAGYKQNLSIEKQSVITQHYVANGIGHIQFDNYIDRQPPYYTIVGQSIEDCSINAKEAVDLAASVKIGDREYPVFRAIGKSSCDGHKFNHDIQEKAHMGYWPVDPADIYMNGLWSALEAVSGVSRYTMNSWVGSNFRTKSNSETDRLEHLELEATGCYHLAADATLDFNAYLEFSFKYSVDLNSATFDSTWKWKIPKTLAPVKVFVEVNFVVRHKGATQTRSLFIGVLTKRPPVSVVSCGNPYYFVMLRFGNDAIHAMLAQNEADIIWVHKLPSTTPQPSWFNSLDTIVRQQQTSQYLAGFSASEIAQAQANNSRFPTPGIDLIFSRRINMREAGADWLFKAYGIDEPSTAVSRAYGYSDDLYSLICDKTWRFEYDSANGLNFWTDAVSQSVGDSESDKYANCFRV